MNTREILRNFNRQDNLARIHNLLSRKYGGEIDVWLKMNFSDTIKNFSTIIDKELNDSSLVGLYGVDDYIAHYNVEYMKAIEPLLSEFMPESVPFYSVTDGEPVASGNYSLSPDEILQSWQKNAGRIRGFRDDKHGERGTKPEIYSDHEIHHFNGRNTDDDKSFRGARRPHSGPSMYPKRHNGAEHMGNPESADFISEHNASIRPDIYHGHSVVGSGLSNTYSGGITFCDQSQIGTNHHHEQLFGSSYNIALNRENVTAPHTATPFGASTAAANERLMSRTDVFGKSSINGERNGIPFYRKSLHNRAFLDKEISETLDTTEYDCDIRGHDMGSLISRINYKQASRDRVDVPDFRTRDRYHDRAFSPY